MRSEHHAERIPSFGDNVRIRATPETQARGIAGLTGNVYGVTTPSVTSVDVIGGSGGNVALNVVIDGQSDGIWLNPELVEFVDHGEGSEITLDGVPKKWTRMKDGSWREEQLGISPMKQISAWLPVAMSLAALALVLGHILFFGIAREADEGAVAHIFQLLMAAQVPVIAFFALRGLSRAPRQTLLVLALQLGAALVALAPVWLLGL